MPNNPLYIEQTSQSKKFLDQYCALAKEIKICIVPGTIVERCPWRGENIPESATVLSDSEGSYQLFNVAYFISETGEILGSYKKKNLWDQERLHLSKGQEKHTAIETSIGKVGLLACWDLAFPEAFRELVRDGADIIIVPTCWTLDESSAYGLALNSNYETLFLNSVLTTRCFENSCAIVFANSGGPADVFVGLSQVVMPFIGAVNVLGHTEGMLLADIDPEVLQKAEHNYRVREDISGKDWHYSR